MIHTIASMSNNNSTHSFSEHREVPFVDLQRQIRPLQDEFRTAIWGVCERADFILGSETERFEQAFARWIGVDHAIGVASGLDALRLSLVALGIKKDDEVILPTNTFIATALAVTAVGARPVLVDCESHSYNMDPTKLAAAVTARTRAILPVHLAGHPADMTAIMRVANHHQLAVVEDACQAHGAATQGRQCGAWGNAGCFSFYPGKNLGAFGDGGIVTTNDSTLAQKIRRLRHYGQQAKYDHIELGCNSRLDTLQAAVLNVKLPRLEGWNIARRRHADQYRQTLQGVGDLHLPVPCSEDASHVYHLFMIETEQRDALQRHLGTAGVQTGIHYPVPIHLQPAYVDLGYRRGVFPVAELLASRILSLPMFPELRSEEIEYVVSSIRQFFGKRKDHKSVEGYSESRQAVEAQ